MKALKNIKGFWAVFLAFLFLMAIILAIVFAPYFLINIGKKRGISCSFESFIECNHTIECWFEVKCGIGKGPICYPQCQDENLKVSCQDKKCVIIK
jgi:hypothetical protein